MVNNKIYSEFASFYDSMDNHVDLFYNFVKDKIVKFNPNAKSILEIGCGTGNVLIKFSDVLGCWGIDISEEMLKVARKKSKKVIFLKEDMRSFDLKKKFDVVFCVFDSINHLLLLNEWNSAFKCAFRHLNNGGLFVFDMNTKAKIDGFGHKTNSFSNSKGNCFIDIDSKNDGIAVWTIKIVRDGHTFVEKITEKAFPIEDVKTLLLKNSSILEIVDSDNNSITDETKRVFFVCQKK